jgi:hypothetical protein
MTKRLSQIETEELNEFSEEFYGVEASKLRRLVMLKHRLYSEKTMKGDEMRDWAQILGLLLEGALDFPINEEE